MKLGQVTFNQMTTEMNLATLSMKNGQMTTY